MQNPEIFGVHFTLVSAHVVKGRTRWEIGSGVGGGGRGAYMISSDLENENHYHYQFKYIKKGGACRPPCNSESQRDPTFFYIFKLIMIMILIFKIA